MFHQLYADVLTRRPTMSTTSYKQERKSDEILKTIKMLQKSNEREKDDIVYSHEVFIRDLVATCHNDMDKAERELRSKMKEETDRAIEEAKKKQWCSMCWEEANLRCCWNTSYCNTKCQE